MPELPEVETVMRGLQSRLEGRRIVSAVAHRPDLRWKLPIGLAQRLTGARVTGFRRRGKYILMRLDGGDSVLLHLGMSGRMVLTPVRPNQPTLHEHLVLETDDGWRVGFVDPRRFGSVDLVKTALEDKHRLLAEIGPEPLEQGSPRKACPPPWPASAHRSKPPCWTRRSSRDWATSMSARRCSAPACRRCGRPTPCPARVRRDWSRPSRTRCARRSPPAVRRSAITCNRTASLATSSMPGRCMATRANPANGVPASRPVRAFAASPSPAAARSIAREPSGDQRPYDRGHLASVATLTLRSRRPSVIAS